MRKAQRPSTFLTNRLLCTFILLLFPVPSASADSLSYEAGLGFYFSKDCMANILRYQHDAAQLFGFDGYYEASYASWNGPDYSEAVALARGIRWAKTGDKDWSFTFGLSHISRTTSNLGQPFEFFGRIAYERYVGRALCSLGWIHYSDGKFLFDWSGRNNGENFLAFSIGMNF